MTRAVLEALGSPAFGEFVAGIGRAVGGFVEQVSK
jgi:hypothetical protein